MFKRNLKIALRKLSRRREFTLINIFGLLIGFTTSMFILLWVNDELSFDRFHKDQDRVQAVWAHMFYENGRKATGTYLTAAIKQALDEEYPEIESVARVSPWPEHQLSVDQKDFKPKGIRTDEEFLDIFNFPVLYGKIEENSLETDKDIIVTEGLAMKLFGKADVVGEAIRIDNTRDAFVRAVVADPPAHTRFQFEYIISLEHWVSTRSWTMGWGNGVVEVYIKSHENVDLTVLNDKIEGLIKQKRPTAVRSLFLKPVSDLYLYADYEEAQLVGGRIDYVKLFTVVAVFIMIIACINFINLSFAESFKRAKEVGVRKVVGAGKKHLTFQFLQESALLVTFAFVLAVISIEILLPSFNTLTGKSISFDLFSSAIGLWFAGLGLVTILIAGIYPSLMLSGFKTIQALKGKVDQKGAGGFGAYLRKGMVVFQFVIAGGLIFATLIIAQQVDYIFNNDRNINRNNIIVLNNDETLIERYESFRMELLSNPSIEAVTSIGELPINVTASTGDPTWEGKTGNEPVNSFKILFAEQDFVPTMKLEMAMGRNYSRDLKSDSASVILNEAAIRGMQLEDPIGKKFSMWGIDARIIGVVKDFHLNSVYDEIDPLVIMNWADNTSYVTVRTAEGRTREALQFLEQKYAEFMPGYIFDYDFMADSHENMYKNELMVKDLARIFGLIAIFISCLGLFGLTSINAQRNVKEIGVRKVLGASVGQVLIRFSRQSLVLPTIASVLMMPLAYYLMQGWLENFKYHIDIQAWTLISVVAISLLIAWFTVSFIAYRAAKMNPVNSLRSE